MEKKDENFTFKISDTLLKEIEGDVRVVGKGYIINGIPIDWAGIKALENLAKNPKITNELKVMLVPAGLSR